MRMKEFYYEQKTNELFNKGVKMNDYDYQMEHDYDYVEEQLYWESYYNEPDEYGYTQAMADEWVASKLSR